MPRKTVNQKSGEEVLRMNTAELLSWFSTPEGERSLLAVVGATPLSSPPNPFYLATPQGIFIVDPEVGVIQITQ